MYLSRVEWRQDPIVVSHIWLNLEDKSNKEFDPINLARS